MGRLCRPFLLHKQQKIMRSFYQRRDSKVRDFIERYVEEIAVVIELIYYICATLVIFGGMFYLIFFMFSLEDFSS
jgi:hypothetical protein